MLTYNEAKELYESAKDKEKGKPIANNTRLYKNGHNYHICLHRTDIIIIKPNDYYELHTGGWRTPTTKERINRFSPINVYQHRGTWLYNDDCVFEEGMVVNSNGNRINVQGV